MTDATTYVVGATAYRYLVHDPETMHGNIFLKKYNFVVCYSVKQQLAFT
jgi:hypothetical protein